MIIYFDTKFSDLSNQAELISFGAVTEDGQEFYTELDPLPRNCSDFVVKTVLPLLDPKRFARARANFPEKLLTWLLQFDEPVLVSDSTWDIYVLRKTLAGVGIHQPGVIQLATSEGKCVRIRLDLTPSLGEDDTALDAYTNAIANHFVTDPRQHHALVDARALRAGCRAAQGLEP